MPTESESKMPEGEPTKWAKKMSLRLLAVYWIALFVATHLPRFQPTLPLRHSDKWLHGSAHAVLAVLLALAWSLRATFGWRQWLAALAILVVYAALDEITQYPVGRHADVADWQADVAGSIFGLAVFLAVRGWRHRKT